jgi:hypothetical protein
MNVAGGNGDWKLEAVVGCPAFYTNSPPCWFHRLMQRLFFGFRWTKGDEK